MTGTESEARKPCTVCGELKPLSEFQRRSGRRSGHESRRGTCKSCMRSRRAALIAAPAKPLPAKEQPRQGKANVSRKPPRPAERLRKTPPEPKGPATVNPTDVSALVPNRKGFIRMRGRTDKGRRWVQDIDLELAKTLVREHAAVLVNRHTIRRLFTNKDFRRFILTRDHHTCRYCGEYGDTIDHLLPRAKGGHTTPDNCVCACMACNQSKADLAPEDFPIVFTGAAARR